MTMAPGSEMRPAGKGRLMGSRRDKRLTTGKAGHAADGQVQHKSTDRSRQAGSAAGNETGSSILTISQAERFAAKVSAYLDGELSARDRAAFEAMLRHDRCLLQEVAELRWIDGQLREMGADLLAEPMPDFLMEASSHLPLT